MILTNWILFEYLVYKKKYWINQSSKPCNSDKSNIRKKAIDYLQRFFLIISIKNIENPGRYTELNQFSKFVAREQGINLKSLCHFYVWMIWIFAVFNSDLLSWAYNIYRLIWVAPPPLIKNMFPNDKIELVWKFRTKILKICSIPSMKKGGDIFVFEEYLHMIIACNIIFHNYKVYLLLK